MRSVVLGLVLLSTVPLAGCEKYFLDRQMNELCRNDGGVKVFETVKLAASDFSADGFPLYRYWFDKSLIGTDRRLGPDYRYMSRDEVIKAGDPLAGKGRLLRHIHEVYRVSDGALLGRSVQYGRSGGDLIVIDHYSSASCPSPLKPLLPSVFVKG